MTSNLTVYTFEGANEVRVVTIDAEPWFVTKDVCRCLELTPKANGAVDHHMHRVSADERRLLRKDSGAPLTCSASAELFPGTTPVVSLVSESGLYKLIMRSDKPAARRFQDWVAREVLPAIRKAGVYISDQVREQHPEAVAEFEARLVAKLPDADVWTSLDRFLKAKGIELPMREYWMAVGQLTERTKTKNAKRFGRLNHDTLLFSVAELEAWHAEERAYLEAA